MSTTAKNSTRYNDYESMTNTQNPFCITDTEPSARNTQKLKPGKNKFTDTTDISSSKKSTPEKGGRFVETIDNSSSMRSTPRRGRFVETIDNSSSRKIRNNRMLVTDDQKVD